MLSCFSLLLREVCTYLYLFYTRWLIKISFVDVFNVISIKASGIWVRCVEFYFIPLKPGKIFGVLVGSKMF